VLADVDILISAGERLVFTFVLFGDEVIEFRAERRGEKTLTGSVFKGIVRKRCRSLDGYFVDVGLEKEAFLQKKPECEDLKEGDGVLVQLKRRETAHKGARLSCRISLPGKYLVYFPTAKKLGVSNRIKSTPYANKLREKLSQLLKEGEGLIIRSSVLKAKEEELFEELKQLRALWEEVKKKAKKLKKGLVWPELPLWARVVRDYWGHIREIITDDVEIWKKLVEIFGEEIKDKLRYSKDVEKFLGRYTLLQLLNRIFSRYVWLKGGGYLVVEETEAMVVIDVNSGEGCGESLEENAMKTNLEALEEAAKQIRLRNLGGIIVVDLIDLRSEENRRRLLEEAKKIFERENVKVKIYGLSPLGLLEMTRRKEEESVLRVLGEVCPTCTGSGLVKSADLVAYLIEKELEKYKGRRMELRVHPRLARVVRELLEKKKLNGWVSIKEVWSEDPNYYELLPLEPY